MLPLVNSDGFILTGIDDAIGYAPGLISPPGSELADNFIHNSDHAFEWFIMVKQNARYISDRSSDEAIEMQVVLPKTEIGFNTRVIIAPGIELLDDNHGNHQALPLSSSKAKEYIERKYGSWGLNRLKLCLRTGNAF